MDIRSEQTLYTRLYIGLILLTLTSVAVSFTGHLGRLAAISAALAFAWVKAGLIGYHFMHLKSERPIVWTVVFVAVLAVIILAVGVFPDLAVHVR